MRILQTDVQTFPLRIRWENLVNNQSIFSLVVTSLILTWSCIDIVIRKYMSVTGESKGYYSNWKSDDYLLMRVAPREIKNSLCVEQAE